MMQKTNVIVTLTVVCSTIMEELKEIFLLVIGEHPFTIQLVRTKFCTTSYQVLDLDHNFTRSELNLIYKIERLYIFQHTTIRNIDIP